jgi:hypothetical protein
MAVMYITEQSLNKEANIVVFAANFGVPESVAIASIKYSPFRQTETGARKRNGALHEAGIL